MVCTVKHICVIFEVRSSLNKGMSTNTKQVLSWSFELDGMDRVLLKLCSQIFVWRLFPVCKVIGMLVLHWQIGSIVLHEPGGSLVLHGPIIIPLATEVLSLCSVSHDSLVIRSIFYSSPSCRFYESLQFNFLMMNIRYCIISILVVN